MRKKEPLGAAAINSSFSSPIDERYFDDYLPGSVYEFGSIAIRHDEVVEFAKLYDPFVSDSCQKASSEAKNGVIVASGWQTVIKGMSLFYNLYISQKADIGTAGIDNIRWVRSVHPGDELSIRVTIKSRALISSKPGEGIIHSYVEIMNQNKKVVTTLNVKSVLPCRKK